MDDDAQVSSRKADHIRINLENSVQSGISNGLERYSFIHQALPDINLSEVDTRLELFGKTLSSPILISSMTGGTSEAEAINRTLASAAQETGVAMGLGSLRAGIDHPELVRTFQVRSIAPKILLFANLGAVQLNYRYGVDECRRAVEMIQADGLFLHLNPLQEALQPEGNTRFKDLLRKIEKVCKELRVPVLIKEVGWGISGETARRLAEVGIAAIDVAGAGGTSWSQVEMLRIKDESLARVAGAFRNWGIPTAESILQVRRAAPGLMVFASGGLRDGVDIAKCVALSATLGGMASPFLKAAVQSVEHTIGVIREIQRTVQVAMFAAGASNLVELQRIGVHKVGE